MIVLVIQILLVDMIHGEINMLIILVGIIIDLVGIIIVVQLVIGVMLIVHNYGQLAFDQ